MISFMHRSTNQLRPSKSGRDLGFAANVLFFLSVAVLNTKEPRRPRGSPNNEHLMEQVQV